MDDFLKSVEVLTQQLRSTEFKGTNRAEDVRAGREEWEQQIGE